MTGRWYDCNLIYNLSFSLLIQLRYGTFEGVTLTCSKPIGQLDFYLEALNRNVKKANENPSIGILLCKDKDDEVVEYALNRSLSPTMVAEYQLYLPDKKILQLKLREIFDEII